MRLILCFLVLMLFGCGETEMVRYNVKVYKARLIGFETLVDEFEVVREAGDPVGTRDGIINTQFTFEGRSYLGRHRVVIKEIERWVDDAK